MQVVYLLVELRKLLDRENYKDSLLRAFSNWVVHTGLQKRSEGITLILTEFDQFIEDIFYRHQKKFSEHLSLRAFRLSLFECFKHFGLSATFVAEGGEWKKFCQQYCMVVSECPIVFRASRIPTKHVKEVELLKVTPGIFKQIDLPFVGWKITLKDGRTLNWSLNMA
jgi:hypothetical protein